MGDVVLCDGRRPLCYKRSSNTHTIMTTRCAPSLCVTYNITSVCLSVWVCSIYGGHAITIARRRQVGVTKRARKQVMNVQRLIPAHSVESQPDV